jgi:mono/diheme cytochrome c family protein
MRSSASLFDCGLFDRGVFRDFLVPLIVNVILAGGIGLPLARAASEDAGQDSATALDTTALAERGKTLWAGRAGCANCHGWAGDGASKEPFPPGANLRKTALDKLQIAQVVRCGRPGTGMPFFDKLAYADDHCYGASAEALGSLAPRAGVWLRANEIDAIVEYVLAQVKGRGKITKAECERYFAASAGCESID